MVNFKDKTIYDYIGMAFLFASIIILIRLLTLPMAHSLIHIDEYFTLEVVKLNFIDAFRVIIGDYHPPFYYILLKIVKKLLLITKVPLDLISALKLFSILPYLILIIFSATKIREQYGWLTAGIFAFSVGIMSDFFISYLKIRMYSWGILFLFLGFVALYGVLTKSDRKSWMLLTIFAVLGAYTQYILAMSFIVLYLLLLGYILLFKENSFDRISELKKWIVSSIFGILLYAPWLPFLIRQTGKVSEDYWIATPDMNEIFHYFYICGTNSGDLLPEIIAIVALIVFLAIVIKLYLNSKDMSNDEERIKEKKESIYLLIGLGVFLGTITVSLILTFTFRPILVVRYLVPSAALVWFSYSIIIGKLQDNKKIVTLLLVLVLLLGSCGVFYNEGEIAYANHTISEDQRLFNQMNNNDSVVIIMGNINLLQFEDFLENTTIYPVYSHKNKEWVPVLKKLDDDNKVKTVNITTEVLEKNQGKTIYEIRQYKRGTPDYGENYIVTKNGTIAGYSRNVFIIEKANP